MNPEASHSGTCAFVSGRIKESKISLEPDWSLANSDVALVSQMRGNRPDDEREQTLTVIKSSWSIDDGGTLTYIVALPSFPRFSKALCVGGGSNSEVSSGNARTSTVLAAATRFNVRGQIVQAARHRSIQRDRDAHLIRDDRSLEYRR